MAAELIKDIVTHLELLGFTCVPEGKLMIAKHPSKRLVGFEEFKGGVLFLSFFVAKNTAVEDKEGFLEFVNRGNKDAIFGRFIADFDGPRLLSEAWYPNVYDRKAFGVFFDGWTSEQSGHLATEAEVAKRYLE